MAPHSRSARQARRLCMALVALAVVLLCAPVVAQAADWEQTTAPVHGWRGIHFPDADNGWAVAEGWYISHTADGGKNWTPQSSGIDPSTGGFQAGLRGVDFVNATTGWACGNDLTVIHTTNGGATWTRQTVDTSFIKPGINGVDFTDALHGCVVTSGSSSSLIYTTADGGSLWTPRTAPPEASAGFYAVTFADAAHGWVVGAYGAIAATSDGGATWTAQRAAVTSYPILFDVAFADAKHGWAVGGNGTILATTDGATWVAQTSNTTQPLQSVDFADTLHGWAVGNEGTCLVTSDGGATWTAKNGGLGSQQMTAVDAVSATKVFAAAGNLGTVGNVFSLSGGGGSRPVPKALGNVTVKKGKKATLRYRVDAGATTCTVKIVIKKGKAVKKTLVVKNAKTNKALTKSFTCTLKKGSYTWSVSATDPSGNTSAKASTKKLTVN